MPEPTDEIIAAMPEPTGTSAVIDDVEVFTAPDQWPTADLTDFDDESWADQ
jgi:hypothetical protein